MDGAGETLLILLPDDSKLVITAGCLLYVREGRQIRLSQWQYGPAEELPPGLEEELPPALEEPGEQAQWAEAQWAEPQWAEPQWAESQWAEPQWAEPQTRSWRDRPRQPWPDRPEWTHDDPDGL